MGKARLEVAFDGNVISKAVMFEYKTNENQKEAAADIFDASQELFAVETNCEQDNLKTLMDDEESHNIEHFDQDTTASTAEMEEQVLKYTLLHKIDLLRDGMERKLENITIKDKVRTQLVTYLFTPDSHVHVSSLRILLKAM